MTGCASLTTSGTSNGHLRRTPQCSPCQRGIALSVIAEALIGHGDHTRAAVPFAQPCSKTPGSEQRRSPPAEPARFGLSGTGLGGIGSRFLAGQ